MLKPVKEKTEFRGAIANATHYGLEGQLLGMPLWLLAEGYEAESLDVMRYIAKQPRELFAKHVHRKLWEVYESLSTRGLLPTEAWIEQEGRSLDCWSDNHRQGGVLTVSFLLEIQEAGTSKLAMQLDETAMPLARETAGELRDLYQRRQVIEEVEGLHASVVENWHPGTRAEIGERIESVQQKFHARPSREESAGLVGPMIRDDIQEIERQLETGDTNQGYSTGFMALDRIIGPLQAGNLAIVAARPSQGKTSLALDISLSLAKQDCITAFFSFEQTRRELVRRITSKECGIDVLRMRHAQLEDWQIAMIKKQFGDDSDLPLLIDEQNYTPGQIESRIREFNRLLNPGRVECAVIDHLQLMGTSDKQRYERRDRQLAAYTGALKDLSKRLGLTTICLSQLNRQVENRPLDQRHPRLSDLRESGAIEQDADIIVGIYRRFPDTQKPEDANHAELCVLKNRSGPCGVVEAQWIGTLAKFVDKPQDGEAPLENPPF